jgi:hypothetical protein
MHSSGSERSGRLTSERVAFILKCAKRCPNDLAAVARIARIYPSDLLGWYLAGQVYACDDLPCAELAWGIAELRFERAAKNQERLEAAAQLGVKRKQVIEADGSIQVTEEDVLPAQWAITRLEEQAAKSSWGVSPNDNIGAALLAALKAANEDSPGMLPPIPDDLQLE